MNITYVTVVSWVSMDIESENIYAGNDLEAALKSSAEHSLDDCPSDNAYIELETWQDGKLVSRGLLVRKFTTWGNW